MPPGLWEGPSERPWVALTFDDGPDPEITPRALDGLRRAQAPATFFVVGNRAVEHPELVRRIQAEGHEVGNHTWSHRPLTIGACNPVSQVTRTEELLSELAPGSPRVFRPPFGFIGAQGGAALRRSDLVPVYWSIVPGDWDPISPQTIRQRVLSQVHPGAVVVLHAGRSWHRAADAVESLVQDLREREYEVVPLSRMLESRGFRFSAR